MARNGSHPVVHLELHTDNLARACAFYTALCGWQPKRIDAGACSYQALGMGRGIGGGVVECATQRPIWLPYVEVEKVERATARARSLGAEVLLAPREGPAGWRSVIRSPAGAEMAFWQPKRETG